jgi:HlyD family type I secretion membrane fusion protein
MPNPTDSVFLRNVDSRNFLPTISRWSTLGGLVLVGACTAAIALTALMQYRVTVKAWGTVRPAGELRLVQSAVEGTLKTIAVQENQKLQRGDLIAQLDDAALQTRKSQVENAIQQERLQLGQLDAQISQVNLQLAAETGLIDRSIAIAEADLSGNQRSFQEKQVTAETELQEAEATLEIAVVQRDRLKQAAAAGAIAQTELEQKEQAVKAAEARRQRARIAINPNQAPVTMAASRIAQEQSKGAARLAALHQQKAALLQRRLELQTQIDRHQKDRQQLAVDLQKTIITAPATGTLLKLQVRNPGQTLHVGEAIGQISPSQAPLIVKARIAVQDIGKVKLGQAVIMRVSAYAYPDYGTLKGKVTAIAPDAVTPPSSPISNAAPYYEITIQPETAMLQRGTQPYPIQSGMEVVADIVSREETVLTFILRKARLLTDL